MQRPTVDYSGFSFKKLNDPRFSHLKLLLGWVGYFILYIITENLIPNNTGTNVATAWDEMIPFCEWFIIPYVGWYLLIVASLLYFMLYNVESFKRLQIFIIVTQITAMIIYIVFPNYQALRFDYPRDNVLVDLIRLIQSADTNSNVCPSLHVAYSIGIASVWLKEKSAAWWTKAGVAIFCILVCMSTVFVKQHAIIDVIVALPVCLLAEYIACKGYWKEKLKR